jgi:hypothetical protein
MESNEALEVTLEEDPTNKTQQLSNKEVKAPHQLDPDPFSPNN